MICSPADELLLIANRTVPPEALLFGFADEGVLMKLNTSVRNLPCERFSEGKVFEKRQWTCAWRGP